MSAFYRQTCLRSFSRPAFLCAVHRHHFNMQRDIYGLISDAKTLFLGVVSFVDLAPKGRLTRKLTHTVNGLRPCRPSWAQPIVVGDSRGALPRVGFIRESETRAHTGANVKLLLLPRQSRGISLGL
jgi:hypothetical protein